MLSLSFSLGHGQRRCGVLNRDPVEADERVDGHEDVRAVALLGGDGVAAEGEL